MQVRLPPGPPFDSLRSLRAGGEMFLGEESLEEGIDDGAADGLMEDTIDAEKVGIIFPEGLW